MGCGAQRGYKKRVRGTEVDVMMLPKIKFEIVVSQKRMGAENYCCDSESRFHRRSR